MMEKTASQKMLIKEDASVILINPPQDFKSLLAFSDSLKITVNQSAGQADTILAFLSDRTDLEKYLPEIKKVTTKQTLVWLCYIKGTSKIKTDINRDSINAYCKENGLQGVAMISIDDNWSALRVRPSA